MKNFKILCVILPATFCTLPLSHAQEAGGVYVGESFNRQTTAQALSACPHHFFGGAPPTFVGDLKDKITVNTYPLCFDGFAVLYSGISRTPLYSAEYLTATRINSARNMTRLDNFHEEDRLPVHVRATLDDYKRSGYDRGHLSPNGDMANESQQFDSFSLANIAPQNGTHNRNVWQQIEIDTRNLAVKYKALYVVTGVLFLGKKIEQIGTGVLVPTHFYKAIYIPELGSAGVYLSANDEVSQAQFLSLDEFTALTGVQPMPNLSLQIRSDAKWLEDGKSSQDSSMSGKNMDKKLVGWTGLFGGVLNYVRQLLQ